MTKINAKHVNPFVEAAMRVVTQVPASRSDADTCPTS